MESRPQVAGARSGGLPAHPSPLAMPAGYRPLANAPDIAFMWESASGGPTLIGTEPLVVRVYNRGYGLREVALLANGLDTHAHHTFTHQHDAAQLARGGQLQFEIASYEMNEPAREVIVSLVSAEMESTG